MDEILLIDAVERFNNGEMSVQEIAMFDELRKNNPEVDQMVVEHLYFLNELNKTAERKNIKNIVGTVENKLLNEGFIYKKEDDFKTKVVFLWKRYKRTIEVAACIALLVSIFTASMVSFYTGKKTSNITPLVDNKLNKVDNKLNNFQNKLNELENKVNNASSKPVRPAFIANFRATGFLIDGKGYIVTNAHVINNANNLIVENMKGEQFVTVPVYSDKTTDLAILKVIDTAFEKIRNLPYSFSKNSGELGERIFSLGYPREEVVYGEGYISSKSGYSGDTTSYQISISANPGNSGGPVINKNGEVIGILSSKETNADGVVFAIKSKNIYNAVKNISSTENIKLPVSSPIRSLERVQQVKKIEDCVFMVKGN